MKISYLPYKDIDKKKWDDCIANSANRLIYGFSFYLDNMAANWDGLVLNDYEAVMPLPWRKKFQIKYLYQPAFVQQGGIFSSLPLSGEVTNRFLAEAAKHFVFAEITLNFANILMAGNKNIKQALHVNYVLPLDKYEQVYQKLDPAFTKSLRRIKKFNIRYEKSDDYSQVIRLYKYLYNKKMQSFVSKDYEHLILVCDLLKGQKKVATRLAYNEDKVLLAATVLIKDENRLYNLISCITEAGKKSEANYFLYDKILEEFSGMELTLDLEGSDVKGIAAFYKKFNPILETYPFIKYNNLHPIIKLIKK